MLALCLERYALLQKVVLKQMSQVHDCCLLSLQFRNHLVLILVRWKIQRKLAYHVIPAGLGDREAAALLKSLLKKDVKMIVFGEQGCWMLDDKSEPMFIIRFFMQTHFLSRWNLLEWVSCQGRKLASCNVYGLDKPKENTSRGTILCLIATRHPPIHPSIHPSIDPFLYPFYNLIITLQ